MKTGIKVTSDLIGELQLSDCDHTHLASFSPSEHHYVKNTQGEQTQLKRPVKL